MRKLTINLDLLMLNIIWIFGCLVLQPLNNHSYQVRLIVAVVCGIYILSRYSIVRKMASAFYLYPIAVFLLTLYHYFPYNLGSFINGVIYALLCFEIFGVLYIVNNLYGVKRTVSSLFNISLIIFVVNCSTVLLMSRNISNATSVYFIGTKFSTSYFNLAIICFWIIIYNKNKLLHRIVLVIISLIGLYCDVYMYSYTGLSMKLVVFGILIIRDFTSVKKKE